MSAARAWPNGSQAAAAVTVNFAGESVEHASMALPLWGRYSHGRYGAQLGVYNLLEVFARHGIRATFFIGGWDAQRYPQAMDQILAAGHEIAGCGFLHEDFSALSREEQEETLARGERAHEAVFGSKPVGFRAPGQRLTSETRAILAARGYRYDSSYSDDDRPYVVESGGHQLVELPLQEPWTDQPYYEKHRVPRVVTESLVDEFDATFGVGGLFTLTIHPRGDYGSGRGARTRALEPVLQAFREHPRLWIASCAEIADWVLQESPAPA
ncbi:MAG TPA: polysaccharide deacetylase family protein [Thermomicrobiaceae bacterium]|nr:polysaccharide deacetylase family protein [Thermomicrobiaceae bacterium]